MSQEISNKKITNPYYNFVISTGRDALSLAALSYYRTPSHFNRKETAVLTVINTIFSDVMTVAIKILAIKSGKPFPKVRSVYLFLRTFGLYYELRDLKKELEKNPEPIRNIFSNDTIITNQTLEDSEQTIEEEIAEVEAKILSVSKVLNKIEKQSPAKILFNIITALALSILVAFASTYIVQKISHRFSCKTSFNTPNYYRLAFMNYCLIAVPEMIFSRYSFATLSLFFDPVEEPVEA